VASVVNINDVLDGHVALELDCVDQLYLNAYVPRLQVGGQVVHFLVNHLGNPVPSPALFEQIGKRFRRAVKAFAAEYDIPILALKKPDRSRWGDRKLDHMRDNSTDICTFLEIEAKVAGDLEIDVVLEEHARSHVVHQTTSDHAEELNVKEGRLREGWKPGRGRQACLGHSGQSAPP
jgi:hypothetical protein